MGKNVGVDVGKMYKRTKMLITEKKYRLINVKKIKFVYVII